MGRIICQVSVENALDADWQFSFDALVNTGTALLTLPNEWKTRFGELKSLGNVELEAANQQIFSGEICGPVKIEIAGFRPVYSEVLFIEMQPQNGSYEPLVGYIVLESCQAAVDMVGHRLTQIKYLDLK